MNNIIFSFIVATLAGISTMFGLIPIYIKNTKENKIIPISLAFSSGVMLSISIFSLIPESYNLLNKYFFNFPSLLITLIFTVIGIIFSILIDNVIEKKITNNKLYKLGIISIIVLVLHNIPEGITTFLSTSSNKVLGLTLSIAIAMHNIPEGISIAVPIYYSTKSKKKAWGYTFVSGFSELFGAILAYAFLSKYINDLILGIILSLTAGIMTHISIYELLPNSIQYKKKRLTIISFLIGFVIMFICSFILS